VPIVLKPSGSKLGPFTTVDVEGNVIQYHTEFRRSPKNITVGDVYRFVAAGISNVDLAIEISIDFGIY
jgi:hypothetical protein